MDGNPKDSDLEQIKMFYDLTKFHVGIYMSAIGLICGVFGSENRLLAYSPKYLFVALLFLLLAGYAGAILLKSVCSARCLSDFWDKRIGPCEWELWPAKRWAYLERTCFWFGMLFTLLAFVSSKVLFS